MKAGKQPSCRKKQGGCFLLPVPARLPAGLRTAAVTALPQK